LRASSFPEGNDVRKDEKQRVVDELTERLRSADTLFVADYRGLTMPQIEDLRARLIDQGARLRVVKNTLTRRAAEAAGSDAILALLEGPTAIAFLEADGDPAAVAKTIADVARQTRVLEIRGGVLEGRVLTGAEVENLATLPPLDVLRGQVLGAIVAPLSAFAGLVAAPLQNLYGLIDARVEQLGGEAAAPAPADATEEAPTEVAAEAPEATEEAPSTVDSVDSETNEETNEEEN
jgi:large subunit ribosomal protein L10